ncbi:hypothetical protein COT20_00030 [bacterium (Candidatus Gribaldobacteria) CG08_land_8_20_14_0_20_39_15]|uniref:Uncharacterized protein n=1 Tax=bacterium (Candidatus Gribaldobacteria) CG08_land_8_20_14_0_20_39_15 TaxID=2014273 RepID=A0A2M6XVG2_9BACT|nr:MAG: hypothetical protein COT20_00030 [bacterium (Candidatus Gribaldobacteria) CG08_land_8_20_14_0_20_39_15]
MKGLIKKIQGLPEYKRKIILWSAIVILGLGLISLYIKNVQEKLRSFEAEKLKEGLQLPSFEEIFKELPKFEMPEIEVPEIDEEGLRELESR